MTTSVTPLISQLFSQETFDAATDLWHRKLSEHLQTVMSGTGPVLNWSAPEASIRLAGQFMNEGGGADDPNSLLQRFGIVIDQMLSSGQNLHHPGYIGHQVPASIPMAGLFDALGTITNQVMAIYEMGPWATAVESALIAAMTEKVGWSPGSGSGILTSGGSLANLTALLTARNIAFPDCWEHGVPKDAVLVTQTDAHYSVARSAGILGLGTRQVLKINLDQSRRMQPDHLNQVLTELRMQGRTVIAVSACACATPTGAFDPLDQIAEICCQHGVWMHVDAAHGGAALMSRTHRHRLAGLHRADSIVWDAHKMMFVPALCAAVLYRTRDHRFQTFRQDAPYLFDPSDPGMAEYDSSMRTIECTKRAAGFGLWGLWSVMGDVLFEQLVDHTFAMARTFFELLSSNDDFVALHEPECNIVAFRYVPAAVRSAPENIISRFQRDIRQRIMRSGRFYIVQTQLGHQAALRVTIMNPLTSADDLEALLHEIRRVGAEVLTAMT